MGDISEQAYSDKLKKVLDYTIEALENKVNKNEAEEAAISFFQSMATEVAVTAGIIAALAFNPASGPFVLAGAWILAGYSAAVFIYDTVNMLIDLADIDLCDEAALQQIGNNLAGSVVDLGVDLLASATLGAVGRLSSAISDAAEYVGLSAWRLWRRLRERFGTDATNGRTCSFDGDTLVLTEVGKKPIKEIQSGQDRVWARDEHTGKMGWRDVLAQYSNHYENTVTVTAIDSNGQRQRITSNKIHPYFARVAVGAVLATASLTSNPAIATEGYVYAGDIVGGAWVDAQYLQPGDELLTEKNEWQTVEAVIITEEPLEAYNLSVDEYETYFVSGEEGADAIWVHNTCYSVFPSGFRDTGRTTDFGQPLFVGGDGRLLYQGHDGRYYDFEAHPPTPGVSGGTNLDPNSIPAGAPGSPEHKALAWEAYNNRDNDGWDYSRWSNNYNQNMTRAREAREVEIAYRDELGWGEINAHTIPIDGESGRRLDIVDIGNRRGVEVKSGYATATEENLSELARDKI